MAEQQLDIIVRAQAQQLPEIEKAMASVEGVNVSIQKHNVVANEAAKAERSVATEARESAKAMGELGARGGELFDRFTALSTAAGGLQGTMLGLGLLAAGAVAEGAKKVTETYQEQESTSKSLKQAADATGKSYEDLSRQFEDFASQNIQYITNQNDAKNALAAFVRAGFDEKESMDALGVTVDLAALKHENLTEAGKQTLLMMEGNSRSAKELGLDIKALIASDDNAATAHKNFEKATVEVTKAQDALDKAQQRLKLVEDEMSAKRKLSAADLDKLAAAHQQVADASGKLMTATADARIAQDDLNKSIDKSHQILGQLQTRVDQGRKSLTDLQMEQNQLNGDFDKFSHDTGPAFNYAMEVIVGTVDGLVQMFDAAVHGGGALFDKLGQIAHYVTTPGGGAPQYSGSFGRHGGGMQHGGPVYPGGTYTVGEAGPEQLVMNPGGGGYVIPGGSGGGGAPVVNVYVETSADPFRIGSEIAWALKYGDATPPSGQSIYPVAG